MQKQNLKQHQLHQSFRIREKQKQRHSFTQIGHYIIVQQLGKGGFATVYKALEIYTKTQVAIKVIDISNLSKKQLIQSKMQIQIQKSLNHPNIVRIYEVMETETKIYIVMQLIKGKQLYDLINKRGALRQGVAAQIFFQVCCAVKYLHDNKISHRDIKTQNIMIDSEFNAKIIDFGLAKNFSNDQMLNTFCGSPSYTAPQMFDNRGYRCQQIDIWCLGVVLFVMLEAQLPFDDKTDHERKHNIQNMNWLQTRLSSPQAIQIYQKIFCNSSDRININQILRCSLFQKYKLFSVESNHYVHDKSNRFELCENEAILQTISRWLGLSIQQVVNNIIQQNLCSSYALYEMLKNKQTFFGLKSLEISTVKTEQRKGKSIKNENYSNREQIRRSVNQSSNHRNRVIFAKQSTRKQSVMQKVQRLKNEKRTVEIVNKDRNQQKGKGLSIGIRSKLKSRNIITRNSHFDQIPKSRFRQNKEESPRRLLDCIKIYK